MSGYTTRRGGGGRPFAAHGGGWSTRGLFSPGGDAGMTRVVMVAGTYRPERCGVAHYVQRLRSALDERGVSSLVLTTKEAARDSKDQRVKGVVRGWGIPDLPALVRAVRRSEPDVIHFQHAAGAYGLKRAVSCAAR